MSSKPTPAVLPREPAPAPVLTAKPSVSTQTKIGPDGDTTIIIIHNNEYVSSSQSYL
jgi:hypothetical protein